MTKWLVRVLRFPVPEGPYTPAQESLLEIWGRYVHAPSNREPDDELFWEQADRLRAALNSFGESNIYLDTDPNDGEVMDLGTAQMVDRKVVERIPRFGHQHDTDLAILVGNPSIDSERKADRYMTSAAFQREAKRRMVLTGNNGEDGGKDIYRDVLDMSQQGVERVFVKTSVSKRGAWDFRIGDVKTLDEMQDRLMDEMDWSLVRYEGGDDAFLVQEFITMEYEYRLFVVDGKLVTGAGCIEEHTPLNNNGEPFSPLVRKNRREVSPVESIPEIRDRLVEYGSVVAQEMTSENPGLIGFVLDVALGADGEPLVIERNSLLNAGLYAAQTQRITDALALFDFSKQSA